MFVLRLNTKIFPAMERNNTRQLSRIIRRVFLFTELRRKRNRGDWMKTGQTFDGERPG